MFKAVLFDLDGTLLDIDMEYFIPQYFRKMVIMARDAGYSIADQLVEKVWQATDVMIANRDARLLNEEVFAEHFYRNWPIPREEFEPFFERFYAEGFPQLQIHSRPFAGIPEMMQQVFDRGLKVVVATNAVFPMIALQQRLDWAGVGHFDYELITSYEVMHFCKPHPEYYQEIAATIGVKPEECLMVGNDIGEDLPAGTIGMKTFLVENMLIDKGQDLTPDWRGYLPDLYEFIGRL
ncbi:MAG: HAD family hydrolase [Syntrophomonadaceae bacterium]